MIYLSGTSPLYVLDTIFSNKKQLPNEYQCIGAVSLIIWSLILVVSMKYAIFILKADNKGEGWEFCLIIKNRKFNFRWNICTLCIINWQNKSIKTKS
jgi:K+ transporter